MAECDACDLIRDDVCNQLSDEADVEDCKELFERMREGDSELTKSEVRETLNSLKSGLYEDFRKRVKGVIEETKSTS